MPKPAGECGEWGLCLRAGPPGPWGAEVETRKPSLRPRGLRQAEDPTHCFVPRTVSNRGFPCILCLGHRDLGAGVFGMKGTYSLNVRVPLLPGAPRGDGSQAPVWTSPPAREHGARAPPAGDADSARLLTSLSLHTDAADAGKGGKRDTRRRRAAGSRGPLRLSHGPTRKENCGGVRVDEMRGSGCRRRNSGTAAARESLTSELEGTCSARAAAAAASAARDHSRRPSPNDTQLRQAREAMGVQGSC